MKLSGGRTHLLREVCPAGSREGGFEGVGVLKGLEHAAGV